MEPLLSIQLFDYLPSHMPADTLRCDYQIDAVAEGEVQAVELSVLWYTEGKGDEDMGVHFFQRLVPGDDQERDLRELHSFSIELPNSPLSYQGQLLEIRWCVRLRAFLSKGRSYTLDHPFWLGPAPASAEADATTAGDGTHQT